MDFFRRDYWVKSWRSEFLPAVSTNNTLLLSYLKSLKIATNYTETSVSENFLGSMLALLRQLISNMEGLAFTWAVTTSALAIISVKELNHAFKNFSKHLE